MRPGVFISLLMNVTGWCIAGAASTPVSLVWPPRDFQSNRFQDFAYLASEVPNQVNMVFNLLGFEVSLLWVHFNLMTNETSSLLHKQSPLSLQSKYLSRTSWPSAREGQTSISTQLWSLTLFHILPHCVVKPQTLSSPHQINIESILTWLQIDLLFLTHSLYDQVYKC